MAEYKKDKITRIVTIITGILLAVTLALSYLVHKAVPFMMDDLWYSTMLFSDTPITSLGDIIKSQVWHYYNWGGRSITHSILQITLLIGENITDLLNIAVTLLLSWMICTVSENRKFFAFFAAFGMLYGLNANWKMSMFWQAGAANYLYITVFILLYLFCYLRELNASEGYAVKSLPGITLWMIPLGIMTGWSNENMGPMAWLLSLAVIFLCKKEKRKVKLWMILGNVFCLAGSVMMIVAPGNFVRSAQAPEQEYGVLWKMFLHCYAEGSAAVQYLFPALIVTAFLLVISKGFLKIPIGRKNILLLLGALLSWGAMILSPHYPDRATFGTMVLLICVILSTAKEIVKQREDMKVPLWGISVFIWLRGMFFLGEFLAISWGWIK